MSNVVSFEAGNVPAFARSAAPSALMNALTGGGASGKRISIRGGVFRLIDAGKEISAIDERYLDIIVVNGAAKISRQYYAGEYAEDSTAMPDCWSADGDKPDKSIAVPQHANCADCEKNIKGSGKGDARACRFNQRLAVVLADSVAGDVLQLQLPAQSLFGQGEGDNRPLQAYARFLASQRISIDTVVTRIKFDTDAAVPKLFFKAIRWLTDAEYEKVQEQGKSEDAVRAITMSAFAIPAAAPVALPGAPPKLAKTPIAEAKTDPVGERGVSEPTVRPPEKPPTPAVTSKKEALASLIDQWASPDDEA
jgi:hypothetical protein